jgi:exodeoxyribonuclease-1
MLEYTFYDNEATGLSKRHDQVTQFGGVTCDESFRVKDSISQFVRLLPYVVPHQTVLSVIRKTAGELCDQSLISDYAASANISRFLTPSRGTQRVFVTYNGIRYDDELLRTALYRNLRYPYFNTGRHSIKIDLLWVVRLVVAVDPQALVVPRDAEGKTSLRLEAVCPANGIQLKAHDAYNDSVATMALFRLVQEKAPWAIELAMQCGSASRMEELLASAIKTGEPIFSFTSFGTPDFAPLAVMATHQKKYIGLDLRTDTYAEDCGRIAEQLYKSGTPFQVVTSNKFPLLLTCAQMRDVRGYELPESLVERANEINKKTALLAAAKDAVSLNTFEKVNDSTSEELIYGERITRDDESRMSAFHAAVNWADRAKIAFTDKRLRDFSARIILDAVANGDAALPADVIRSLAIDCSEALCRPFAASDSRYTTISKCIADGADDAWTDWASERYGDHPVFDAVPRAMMKAPAAGQMAFGF